MIPQTSDWTAVVGRLEKLEKQNRRLKQVGAVALVLAVALLLMGQVWQTQAVNAQAPATRTVEANEFVLKDANGKVRGRWSMTALGPAFALLDGKGRRRAELYVLADVPRLTLFDGNEKRRAVLGLVADSPRLALFDGNGNLQAELDRTSLELSDEEGFKTTIGSTNLVTPRTGETHTTSAASVVLFDKDKNVLWKAP